MPKMTYEPGQQLDPVQSLKRPVSCVFTLLLALELFKAESLHIRQDSVSSSLAGGSLGGAKRR
jgi:uncharacterized membrane protein (DUF373 family)